MKTRIKDEKQGEMNKHNKGHKLFINNKKITVTVIEGSGANKGTGFKKVFREYQLIRKRHLPQTQV